MHFDQPPAAETSLPATSGSWTKELTRYHWFVFIVAALGWLFDTMDQQLFNLARKPAVSELLRGSAIDQQVKDEVDRDLGRRYSQTNPAEFQKLREQEYAKRFGEKVDEYGGYTTSIFIIGWALGGLCFGILGDRVGRARTMLLTILLYSAFTGLSAISMGIWDFAFYRFLTGLGVGGEFAVGVSLVAEVMPDRARPFALGWLQALSAVGNMIAAVISIVLGNLEQSGAVGSTWRAMFLIGLGPALLAIPIFLRLKEPESWKAAALEEEISGEKRKLGSLAELFGDPTWRRHTIVGMMLAFAGVVGLWGIGFFSFDLVRTIFRKTYEAEGLDPKLIPGKLTSLAGYVSLLQNFGAFFGIYAFSRITHYTGRKPAFAISFVLAMVSTAFTFWFLQSRTDILWMIPVMGFCQLSLFGGYAIYFPELFPTRLRSTGTSFCYNVGRLVAAVGPSLLGLLTSRVFAGYDEPMRYAGVAMCSVFVLGLAALPFAPETKGKPLPK
jgi:MFS family permease